MKPCSMPNASSSTFAIGATQLVVHEAFEITLCAAGSYRSSFTPRTTVRSSPLAGALMTTFCAPASRCLSRLLPVGEQPRRLDHDVGAELLPREVRRVALGDDRAARRRRPRCRSSLTATSPSNVPRTESYFSRCASVVASVMSFTATKSRSAPELLRGAEEVPADPSEPVDADLDGHGMSSSRVVVATHPSERRHHVRPGRLAAEWNGSFSARGCGRGRGAPPRRPARVP